MRRIAILVGAILVLGLICFSFFRVPIPLWLGIAAVEIVIFLCLGMLVVSEMRPGRHSVVAALFLFIAFWMQIFFITWLPSKDCPDLGGEFVTLFFFLPGLVHYAFPLVLTAVGALILFKYAAVWRVRYQLSAVAIVLAIATLIGAASFADRPSVSSSCGVSI